MNGEFQEPVPSLAIERNRFAVLSCKAIQFIIDIGFNILGAIFQCGEFKGLEIDTGKKIGTESTFGYQLSQVAVCPEDELKTAAAAGRHCEDSSLTQNGPGEFRRGNRRSYL